MVPINTRYRTTNAGFVLEHAGAMDPNESRRRLMSASRTSSMAPRLNTLVQTMNDMHDPMRDPVNAIDGRVAEELVGEAWPSAHPGEDATLYGHVDFEPRDPVEVRSLQTFRLHYTVGRYGLDDTGAIKIAFRAMGDGDALQTSDPTATQLCDRGFELRGAAEGRIPQPRLRPAAALEGADGHRRGRLPERRWT